MLFSGGGNPLAAHCPKKQQQQQRKQKEEKPPFRWNLAGPLPPSLVSGAPEPKMSAAASASTHPTPPDTFHRDLRFPQVLKPPSLYPSLTLRVEISLLSLGFMIYLLINQPVKALAANTQV